MQSTADITATKHKFVTWLKGGVVARIATIEHARIAEEAGVAAVTMRTNPELLHAVKEAVSIPVITRCRHAVEAEILQYFGADGLEEAGASTRAKDSAYIWKHNFKTPFICEVSDLSEALLKISEGAAIIRTRRGVGTGNFAKTTQQIRGLFNQLHILRNTPEQELMTYVRATGASLELIKDIKEQDKLPIPVFAFGGITTPTDAALVMKLGAQGVFAEEDIFQTANPNKRLAAIVRATRFPDCIEFIGELSRDLEGTGEKPKGTREQSSRTLEDNASMSNT